MTMIPDATLKGPRKQTLVGSAAVLAAVLVLCGCAVTQAPLKPDHGYPADWPQLIALSEGLPELNGIYANKGVATTGDGKIVAIALTDLVPRTTPRKKGSAEKGLDCEDCVALRILPPKGDFLPAPKLRFTLPPSSDVASACTCTPSAEDPPAGRQQQFAGDALFAPERILARQAPDQLAQFQRNRRSSRF